MPLKPPTTFVFSPSILDESTDQPSVLERELLSRAATAVMMPPHRRVCREVALEIIARAAAVDGITVALVHHGTRGADAIDWVSDGISVRPCISDEIYAGTRGPREVRNLKARIYAIRTHIATGKITGGRLVLVDRAVADDACRVWAARWLSGYVGDLALIDPSPWGLTDGGAIQVSAALGIDAPGPQPRRVLDDGGDLF